MLEEENNQKNERQVTALTVFAPQRIHPKFNYFQGEFSKRNGLLSLNTYGALELAPRNAFLSPIRTQAIRTIDDQGFTLLQLVRWILKWFIRFIYIFCHIFLWGWRCVLNYCKYLRLLNDSSGLRRTLSISHNKGKWQREVLCFHFCAHTTLFILMDLGCKDFSCMQHWLNHTGICVLRYVVVPCFTVSMTRSQQLTQIQPIPVNSASTWSYDRCFLLVWLNKTSSHTSPKSSYLPINTNC